MQSTFTKYEVKLGSQTFLLTFIAVIVIRDFEMQFHAIDNLRVKPKYILTCFYVLNKQPFNPKIQWSILYHSKALLSQDYLKILSRSKKTYSRQDLHLSIGRRNKLKTSSEKQSLKRKMAPVYLDSHPSTYICRYPSTYLCT